MSSNFREITEAELNQRDRFGRNKLMTAVINNDVEFIRYFAKQSQILVDWNQTDENGDTILKLAAKNGRADIAKILRDIPEIGLNIRNKNGKTNRQIAMDIADDHHRTGVAQVLSLDQGEVCKKLKKYIDIQSKIRGKQIYQNIDVNALVKGFYTGQCSGLAGLWAYHKLQGENSRFFGELNLIASWDESADSLKAEDAFLTTVFEQFINKMQWLQQQSEILDIQWSDLSRAFELLLPEARAFEEPKRLQDFKGTEEEHTKILSEEIEKLKKTKTVPVIAEEFRFAFVLKNDELKETLENVVNDGKMIHIAGPNHAIGIMRVGNRYYAYDSNSRSGEKEFQTLDKLQNYIKKTLFEDFDFPTDNMSIVIGVFDQGFMVIDENTGKPKLNEVTQKPEIHHSPYPYKKTPKELASTFLQKNDDVNRESVYEDGLKSDISLTLVCKEQRVEILKSLLKDHNIDLKKKDLFGWSGFMYAASNGNIEIVKPLIEAGLDEMDCLTGMLIARTYGNSEAAKLFGQSLDHKNPWIQVMQAATWWDESWDKKTGLEVKELLHKAMDEKKVLEMKTLAESLGDAINKQDSSGMTALMWAAQNGNEKMVQMLLNIKGIDLNWANSGGKTALMLAAEYNNKNVIKLFAEAKVRGANLDLDTQDHEGRSAAMLAEEYHNTEVMELLIRLGSKIDLHKKNDKSVLMEAVTNGQLDDVNVLIETKEIDLNESDDYLMTPLMLAARQGDAPIVKALLEARTTSPDLSININLKSEYAYSALMYAVMGASLDVVKLLIARKEIDKTDCFDAILEAVSEGYTEIAETIIASLGTELTDYQRLLIACAEGDILLVKSSIAKVISSHSEEEYFNTLTIGSLTPLMIAARYGRPEIVKIICESIDSLNVNYQTPGNWTALMWASAYGHLDTAKELLNNKNIDVNAKDAAGKTAMQLAAHSGSIEIVELLINRGTNRSECIKILGFAVYNNDDDIIEIIEQTIKPGKDEIEAAIKEAAAQNNNATTEGLQDYLLSLGENVPLTPKKTELIFSEIKEKREPKPQQETEKTPKPTSPRK